MGAKSSTSKSCTGNCESRWQYSTHTQSCPSSQMSCPSGCGKMVLRRDLLVHKFNCRGPDVICPYCKDLVSEKDLQGHRESCPSNPFAEVFCPLNCGWKIQRQNLAYHQSKECLCRIILCKFCSKGFTAKLIEDHQESCPSNPCPKVPCPQNCGWKIQRQNLADHQSKECPCRIVLCKFCSHELPAKLVEVHQKSCYSNPCGEVPCPLNCGLRIQRSNLADHQSKGCPCRFVPCKFCSIQLMAKYINGHQYFCSKAKVSCPLDCGWKIQRQSLNDHKSKECPLRIVHCEFCNKKLYFKDTKAHELCCDSIKCPRGCGETFKRTQQEKHQMQLCPLRNLTCHYCEKVVSAQDFSKHLEECSEAPLKCHQCSKSCQRRFLPTHLNSICPERSVTCGRCKRSFKAKEGEEHKLKCEHAKMICPKNCGKSLLKGDIKDHLQNDCLFRDLTCILCKKTYSLKNLDDHRSVCEKRLIACSYCKAKWIAHDKLEEHYKKCPMKPRPYPYESFERHFQGMSAEIENLENENRIVNLRVKSPLRKERKEAMDTETDTGACKFLHYFDDQPQIKTVIDIRKCKTWKVSDYSKLKRRSGTTWVWSESYTTGDQGYFFTLGMRICRTKFEKENKVGLFICLYSGPFDDELTWPFPYTVRFKIKLFGSPLKNTMYAQKDSELCSISMKTSSVRQRPHFDKPRTERNKATGRFSVMSLGELENPDFGYINDDALTFLVDVF